MIIFQLRQHLATATSETLPPPISGVYSLLIFVDMLINKLLHSSLFQNIFQFSSQTSAVPRDKSRFFMS